MLVEITRTSTLGDSQPIDGAFEADYSGETKTGSEYSGTTWLLEVDSLAELVDMVEREVIIREMLGYDYGLDTEYDVSYHAEIYDDYRE